LKILRLLVFCLLPIQFSVAQSAFAPYSEDYYHLLERLEVKSGQLSNEFHDNIKPFESRAIARFLDALSDSNYSKVDKWNLNYLKTDNWAYVKDSAAGNGKPFLKHLFKKQSDLYSVKNKDFDIHVSPVFYFGGGRNFGDNGSQGQFINSRGIRINGSIGNKIGFYTDFTENQSSTPFYVKQFYKEHQAFPYSGYTRIIGFDETKLGIDYMQASGYVAFKPSKNFLLRFGHSKNFIGSGIRSMILSDFSAPYLNLMMNVRLGRLEYQSILANMNNKQVDVGVNTLEAIPQKYMTFHHLNLNITKNVNVGLFETVMFGERAFDLNYLNPIIFYRFVEGLIGSRDNALVGTDFKILLGKSVSVYGQYILDEFNSEESKKEGWYGQKNAGQIGLKYFDLLRIKQLDFQAEYNYARPYTYSHYSSYTNLVNYNTPIAHPLGANFKEFVFVGRYSPITKIFFKATLMKAVKGYDDGTTNYGGDILKSYRENRVNDFGNFTTQGVKRSISLFRLETSYMLGHNFYLDFSYQNRSYGIFKEDKTKDSLINFGVRWNAIKSEGLY
jgi:hypothetical protein